jgi:hypothetical protein
LGFEAGCLGGRWRRVVGPKTVRCHRWYTERVGGRCGACSTAGARTGGRRRRRSWSRPRSPVGNSGSRAQTCRARAWRAPRSRQTTGQSSGRSRPAVHGVIEFHGVEPRCEYSAAVVALPFVPKPTASLPFHQRRNSVELCLHQNVQLPGSAASIRRTASAGMSCTTMVRASSAPSFLMLCTCSPPGFAVPGVQSAIAATPARGLGDDCQS